MSALRLSAVRLALVVAAFTACSSVAWAAGEPVTFAKDVAPILQEKCQACHRADSIAPMSLITYEETRPWARAIKTRVVSRQMPPWDIDKTVGIQHFENDSSLSDEQIDTIARWVDAGAPLGTRPTCRRDASGRRPTAGITPRSSVRRIS